MDLTMEDIPVIKNKDMKEVLPDRWFQIQISVSVIWDHTKSKEPMSPSWERVYRFMLMITMEHIPVIRNKDMKEVLPDKWFQIQISVADYSSNAAPNTFERILDIVLAHRFHRWFDHVVGGGGEDRGERPGE